MSAAARYLVLFVALAFTACGTDKEKDEKDEGPNVPASIVSEADLKPGTLGTITADDLKKEMSEYTAFYDNEPEDTDDSSSCSDKAFDTLKFEGSGDTLVLAGEVDLSHCTEESFKKEPAYAKADFTGLTSNQKFNVAFYAKCEGVDLEKFVGKSFSAVEGNNDCAKSTMAYQLSEITVVTKLSGKIKGFESEGKTYDLEFDVDGTSRSVTRSPDGSPCSSEPQANGDYKFGSCLEISHDLFARDRSGITGSVETDKNEGKSEYIKIEYVDLTKAPSSTSVWYTGGSMKVSYYDWSGTVTFTGATAEPTFEMTRGSATVTGTVVIPAAELKAALLHKFGL